MKKSEIGSNDSPFPVDKSLQGSGIDKPEPMLMPWDILTHYGNHRSELHET
jgi:hypothetical protein